MTMKRTEMELWSKLTWTVIGLEKQSERGNIDINGVNYSPHDTFISEGCGRPGYVNVQLDIFKMARVLLRTPIKEPGGGNENLTDVAASV
jgi:hypothetical protein